MKTGHTQTFGRRTDRSAATLTLPSLGWKSAGALALLCSGVAWASLPSPAEISNDQALQWRALGVKPLSDDSANGMRMAATDAVRAVDYVPERTVAPEVTVPPPSKPVASVGPVRIRGRVGDGLYWSLRAAGAAPDVAAQYLAALATEIDVGEVGASDGFDLVLGSNRQVLYAGLSRVGQSAMQLVRWDSNGRSEWI